MRNVFEEYRKGQISWDEAFFIANNLCASACVNSETEEDETEFYAKQMESLGVDLACSLMTALGYKQDNSGVYYKPGSDN